jgi:hypothetical protein
MKLKKSRFEIDQIKTIQTYFFIKKLNKIDMY